VTTGWWTIRAAEPGDHDPVLALWEEAGLGHTAPDEWEALVASESNAVIVAVSDGDIIGTAIASYDGWRAYIYHVAVARARRREGVSHALMREAERYLIVAGARHVYVAVHEENTEGLALIAATGYVPEGERVLVKRLAKRTDQPLPSGVSFEATTPRR
jgi:ribosomal protein S18 acetylase RimI-like enzyme